MLLHIQKDIFGNISLETCCPNSCSQDASRKETTVLNKLVRRYKGNVVYVDIWATWCGPCIAQFPFSKELQQETSGKDIVFAYLCADSSPREWKSVRAKHQLSGEHYLLTSEEILRLFEKYNFNGYPHYMIINKDGALETSKAIQPQMKEALVAMLLDLLD